MTPAMDAVACAKALEDRQSVRATPAGTHREIGIDQPPRFEVFGEKVAAYGVMTFSWAKQ
jgi:hypothetical protein